MVHEILLEGSDLFYSYWQGHRTALILDFTEETDKYKQWDTVMLKSEAPRWRTVPMFRKISFIDYIKDGIVLHLGR